MNSKKKCISCGEKIKSGAVKCKHCGSYQNWRKYLNPLNTLIALSIGLVTVITISIKSWDNAFSNKSAELDFSFTTFDYNENLFQANVIVSNESEYPAYLNHFRLEYNLDSLSLSVPFFFKQKEIESKSSKEFSFTVTTDRVMASFKGNTFSSFSIDEAKNGLDQNSPRIKLVKIDPKLPHWTWYNLSSTDQEFMSLSRSVSSLGTDMKVEFGYRTYDGMVYEDNVLYGEVLSSIFLDFYEETLSYLFRNGIPEGFE